MNIEPSLLSEKNTIKFLENDLGEEIASTSSLIVHKTEKDGITTITILSATSLEESIQLKITA